MPDGHSAPPGRLGAPPIDPPTRPGGPRRLRMALGDASGERLYAAALTVAYEDGQHVEEAIAFARAAVRDFAKLLDEEVS